MCDSGCNYTTLTSAYSAASCGDTIEMGEETTTGSPLYFLLTKACTSGSELTVVAKTGVTPEFSDTNAAWNDGVFNVSGDYHILDGLIINGVRAGSAIRLTGDHNTIQNVEISNISTDYYPTGNNGTSLLILGDFNVVQDTTMGDGCDHDAIGITGGNYNKILNNTITCDHGHGVSLLLNCNYNLIDGNDITNVGDLCSGDPNCVGKNAIHIMGSSNNTVRRNVGYDVNVKAMELDAYNGTAPNADDNLIYNNTFYNIGIIGAAGISTGVHIGTSDSGNTKSVTGNVFTNNIMDKAGQEEYTDWSNRKGIVFLFFYNAETDLGDDLTALETTNDWRGNHLKNNIIRPYYDAAYQPSAIYAISYTNTGNTYQPTFTVSAVNGVGSMANNATTDPLFVSTNTATFEWWHLQSGSTLIDGGVVVSDTNGSYVETNFSGFGWDDLTYVGSAPDIGAFEFPAIASDFSGITISGGTVQ